jgi:predicted outer membrane repeat protein
MTRPYVVLSGALLLFAGCTDGELPTGLPLERPAFATAAVGCDADPAARVAALIQAIEDANTTAGADVITLAAGCTYTLTSVNNNHATVGFRNGLPVITGELTIHGNGATITRSTEEGTLAFRILEIASGATVSISGLTVSNGRAARGGGIYNSGTLDLTTTHVSGNMRDPDHPTTTLGAGIFNVGRLTLTNSTVSSNTFDGTGGGIYSAGSELSALELRHSRVSNNTAGTGGGIFMVGGTATLVHTTISDNTATGEGGGLRMNGVSGTIERSTVSGNSAVQGGGIRWGAGPLTITHSTVSGNSATTHAGGGIYTTAPLTITHSTLWGNSASSLGGGIRTTDVVTLRNTIIGNSPSGGNCSGTIADDGYNLEDGTSCGFTATGSLSSANPLLGPLANNGGPTRTHALLSGSPAINAGDPAFSDAAQPFDQRGSGFPRVQHDRLDIGAFEFACPAGQDYDVAADECVSADGWVFGGFLPPVSGTSVNAVKAGQAVPVKFSLGGDRGLAIFAAGSPSAPAVPCNAGDPTDEVTQVVSAGGSSLSYDASTGVYTYVWKTDKAWANTCRRLTLSFTDGSTHTASFRFTR